MINLLKSIYISGYTTLLAVASTHSIIELSNAGLSSAWPGILIALLPSLFFFVRLFVSPVPRTSANLNSMLAFAIGGSIFSLIMASTPDEWFFSYLYGFSLSIGGGALYIYWYSRLGRNHNNVLENGQALPAFELKSSEGTIWNSEKVEGHPALMLFFRGNWCPLCMAQIKEVASHYQQLEEMGIKVYLVSPQPEKNTQSLAKKFKVNYNFMVDENNKAAKILGIDSQHGTPKGLEVLGYDSDTVLPTAILTDSKGNIIFTDQTDNYRVRPEPETFIKVFAQHGMNLN